MTGRHEIRRGLASEISHPAVKVSISAKAPFILVTQSGWCHWQGFNQNARSREQTIRQKLPEGFQRSEFLLEHGMLDAVVHRRELKNYISRSLAFMQVPQA